MVAIATPPDHYEIHIWSPGFDPWAQFLLHLLNPVLFSGCYDQLGSNLWCNNLILTRGIKFYDSFVTNLLWQTVFFSKLLLLTTNENFLQFFSYFSYRRISWKYFLFDLKCVLYKLIWFLFGFSVERKSGFAVDWCLCCILLGFRAPCSCIHTFITDLWNSFFSFLLFLIL
jgi:hypothetical protein